MNYISDCGQPCAEQVELDLSCRLAAIFDATQDRNLLNFSCNLKPRGGEHQKMFMLRAHPPIRKAADGRPLLPFTVLDMRSEQFSEQRLRLPSCGGPI